uniref:Uncharacterized protein n=1 Tax=Neobodo designis TaxID=312471 RepID=A0A7S1M2P8_NEODS|mmetsp:Transcript_31647/g.97832  ORF Transcript_31647/g.97832 Transcript_31647/m.97832 type:complete len:257 (+) Transcript_31647:45-815(+)
MVYREGQDITRYRAPPKNFQDGEARRQCSLCCAGRMAMLAFGFMTFFTLPPVFLRGYMESKPILPISNLINHWLLLPVPFAASCFTHQYLMSNALWSKNEKTVWDIQWECTLMNLGGWYFTITAATLFSRNVLVKYSREWRVRVWDHRRQRRAAANKYFPPWVGKFTEDMDAVVFLWMLHAYQTLWVGASWALDRSTNATYSFFFRQLSYSKHCGPRWREHREVEIDTATKTEFKPPWYRRWGNYFNTDEWRDAPQ